MGIQVSREVIISAPRDRVWSYVSDFARHPEWAEPKHQLRVQAPAEVRAGATFTSVGKDMGRDSRNAVTITEVVPGSRLVYEARQPDGTHWRNTIALTDAGSATKVVKSEALVSARFPMSVLIGVLSPVLRAETAKLFDGDLRRIKSRLEGASVAVAS